MADRDTMKTSRLEAFSDGVLAIIITIMVLEMKVPDGASLANLQPVIPVILTYLFSFIMVGIYWNNHHHLMHIVEKVNGKVLWANLHLLFWLSLLPFATRWMGLNHFEETPVALYGLILLMSAVAWTIMTFFILQNEGKDSRLHRAYEKDRKQYVSLSMYVLGLALAYIAPVISVALYVGVAALWFVPDKRIERNIG